MTKPSRIVKSAWKSAGKPGSLKTFARDQAECFPGEQGAVRLWFANKKGAN